MKLKEKKIYDLRRTCRCDDAAAVTEEMQREAQLNCRYSRGCIVLTKWVRGINIQPSDP